MPTIVVIEIEKMHYQVSILNSVKIVLKNGKRLVYSLPCDRKGALFMKWDTDESRGDKSGQEERRLAIEKSPIEGYFSSHEQRIPRRFHFAFYLQLRKIHNDESWNCEDVKSMRTSWCYIIKEKVSESRGGGGGEERERGRRRRRRHSSPIKR